MTDGRPQSLVSAPPTRLNCRVQNLTDPRNTHAFLITKARKFPLNGCRLLPFQKKKKKQKLGNKRGRELGFALCSPAEIEKLVLLG